MSHAGVPQISVKEVARKLADGAELVILDVREPFEVLRARLPGPQVCYAPVSRLAREGLPALPAQVQDRQAEIVVVCHHGVRSADVTAWLRAQGWERVASMTGGLEAYAVHIDSSIGRY
jgi:rhodanese-related sulfurtransferase